MFYFKFWRKCPIPGRLPAGMEKTIERLKGQAGGEREKFLHLVYEELPKKYKSYRLRTYTRFWQAFDYDLEKIWNRGGFLHCNLMNYLMRVMLVKSGLFRDEEIELKHTHVWYCSLHQYLRVHLSKDHYVNVDVWGAWFKKGIGQYAHGFK